MNCVRLLKVKAIWYVIYETENYSVWYYPAINRQCCDW